MNTPDSIVEPLRTLAVTGRYDVVVAGGGIAGVAAAVAAARAGASTLLLERSFALGGLATLGNVTVWLPLCDGKGRQVIGGIAAELLHLSVSDLKRENETARFTRIPECWLPGGNVAERREKRYRVCFNPAAYMLSLEAWLLQAGVTLLYDTRVCAVQRRDAKISHLIIENKSGRSAIACGSVVDASGDADVCHFAGETTESLAGNVAAGWFYYLHENRPHLRPASHPYARSMLPADITVPGYAGDDAAAVTAQVVASRKLLRQELTELAAKEPASDLQPFNVATTACLRATRRLVGTASLCEDDMHRWHDDALCLTGDWRRSGPVFAITPDMLFGVANHNLTTAGRCISADTTIWDCTRAIPTCALTGEVSGLAAAIAARHHEGNLKQVSIPALQQRLRACANLLTPELAAPAPAP